MQKSSNERGKSGLKKERQASMPQPKDTLAVRVQGHRTFKKGENDGPWRLSDYEVQVDDIDCVTGKTYVPLIPLADRQMLFDASAQDLLPAAQRHLLGSIAAAEEFFERIDLQKETKEMKAETKEMKAEAEAAEAKATGLQKTVTTLKPDAEKYRVYKEGRSIGGRKGAKITNAAKAERSARWEKAVADLMEPTTLTGEMKTARQMAKDCWNKPESEWIRAGIIKEDGIPSKETIRKIIAKLPE